MRNDPSAPKDAAGPGWARLDSHRQWLTHSTVRLLEFARTAIRPEGGFHYQGEDGSPQPGKAPATFLTARLVHASAIGVASGIPGAGRLLEHGMESLLGGCRDAEHGGWFATADGAGRKSTYDQVQVALAAASATAVRHPRAGELLDAVTAVLSERLWSPAEGALLEDFAADWSDPEPYRGANSNMHGIEAMLALGDVTGEAEWHRRALQIAERIVDGHARELGWLIPEHFTTDWRVQLEYNADQPTHPFRPYGATYGHSFEWARFLIYLHRSPLLTEPRDWLLEAAIGLTRRALASWGVDGTEGIVYTVDWDERPVARERMHWPVCEAIQTVHVLSAVDGSAEWERWYRRLWEHSAAHFIDERGTWRNELDAGLAPSGLVWPGRPDYYHCIGAYTVPRVPVTPFMTLALTRLAR